MRKVNIYQFNYVKAVMEGNEVVVNCDKADTPEAVRYALADNPECILVNSERLLSDPFRIENWKGIIQK